MTDENLLGIRGRRALVVGGGFGTGREMSLLLARAGATVVVADVDEDRAKSVAAEAAELGVTATAIAADVTDTPAAERLVNDAASRARRTGSGEQHRRGVDIRRPVLDRR